MSERAITLWTELVEAMRADGLIAHCVTKSGPATTAVVLKAVSTPPWVKADIKPEPGRIVVARIGPQEHTQVLAFWNGEHWEMTAGHDEPLDVIDWRFL